MVMIRVSCPGMWLAWGTFNMPTYWLNFQSVSYKGALNLLYPKQGEFPKKAYHSTNNFKFVQYPQWLSLESECTSFGDSTLDSAGKDSTKPWVLESVKHDLWDWGWVRILRPKRKSLILCFWCFQLWHRISRLPEPPWSPVLKAVPLTLHWEFKGV